MAYINLEREDHLRQAIKAHKRTLLEADWKAQSLENGFPIMQTQAVQDVLKQVDDVKFEQYCDTCGEPFAGLDISDPGDGTCWYCLHPNCEDYPCQDCLEHAADRAHDMSDMER